jgi:pyruvate,water dikinase
VVRSSAPGEDGADASFAGQYESVLDLQGVGAVSDAVRLCRASGAADRVAAYRGSRPAAPTARAAPVIPVLVQRLVSADVAGVAFSANPVTGDQDETLISAVRGLADRLTDGAVTAEEWVVRDGVPRLRSGGQDALTHEQAGAVAALTQRVAAYFGRPQDVEWAIAGDALWLLQARPVTALPESPVPVVSPPGSGRPSDYGVPSGFWTRAPGADRPWLPLHMSVYLPVLARHLGGIFTFAMTGPPLVTQIGGYAYVSASGTGPSPRERAAQIAAATVADEPLLLARRWREEWKPTFAGRIAQLRDRDLTGLTPADLIAHARAVAVLFDELHAVYFQLAGASSFIAGQLGLACEELLGWVPGEAIKLRGGLRGDHMAAVTAVGDLARMAARDPRLRADLERPVLPAAAELAPAYPQFAAAFAAWQRQHGHRTAGFDLAEPTLAEQPEVVLSLIRAQLSRPFDLDAERAALDSRLASALATADAGLLGCDAAEQNRFRSAVAASDESGEVRDEKAYYAVSAWALLRYAVLEVGSRLARSGQLADPDDVLLLRWEEALSALAIRAGRPDLRDLVRRRRDEHALACQNPPPRAIGQPPATGPVPAGLLAELDPAARRAVEASVWAMRLWGGAPPAAAADSVLSGLAASAGRYTGPVRVVAGLPEFGKVRPGDVLVCARTTAQWSVLFPGIGALVTDEGGLLSHPAIIAREYGVPAVVATREATRVLRDSQVVTVDGSAGTVRAG